MPENSRSPLAFIGLTLLATSLLLVWNSVSRYQDYLGHQQELAQRVARSAASELSVQIRELRHRVRLFAGEERAAIARVARNPEDMEAYDRLEALVDRHFRDHIAFGVARADGEPAAVDFDNPVGDVCLADLARFTQGGDPYAVYLHPQPGAYHFDVMAPWRAGPRESGAFFVSFPPDMVARVLRHGELEGHRLLVLHAGQPGLVEVTSEGARDQLAGAHRLAPEALARAGEPVPVPGTRWVVAHVPAPGIHSTMRDSIARETGLFIVSLVLLSLLMVRFMRRSEARRFAAEASLRRAHHELELRIRDRTRRLTEANAELRKLFDEHRVSERTLREREATLRAVLESTVDGIVVMDEHGTIQTFNRAAEGMFGYSADEVLGQNVKILMPEPWHGEHDAYLSRYLETGHRKIIGIGRRVEGLRRDGTTFPLDLAVSEARIGRHRLYTGILRDLSAQGHGEQPPRTAAGCGVPRQNLP